jgi:hypothetical protein
LRAHDYSDREWFVLEAPKDVRSSTGEHGPNLWLSPEALGKGQYYKHRAKWSTEASSILVGLIQNNHYRGSFFIHPQVPTRAMCGPESSITAPCEDAQVY